ncbi:hypothetical protein C8J57DRAFT_1542716 [Mycena rebaudengoi]|nr:hypothetical protein C8J57DRAFT_1542716 [Mycena rebaudengoi]
MHPEKSSAGLECSSSKRFSTILSTGAAPSSSFPAVSPEPMSSAARSALALALIICASDFSVFQDEAASALSNASDRRRCRQRTYEQCVGVRRDERCARREQQPVHHVDEVRVDERLEVLHGRPAVHVDDEPPELNASTAASAASSSYSGSSSPSSSLSFPKHVLRADAKQFAEFLEGGQPCRWVCDRFEVVAEDSRHGGLVESPGNGTGLGHASLTATAAATVVVVGKRLVLIGSRFVVPLHSHKHLLEQGMSL